MVQGRIFNRYDIITANEQGALVDAVKTTTPIPATPF